MKNALLLAAPSVGVSDRLGKISLFYHREAQRCANNRAYFAACILTGAALEALLLSNVLRRGPRCQAHADL